MKKKAQPQFVIQSQKTKFYLTEEGTWSARIEKANGFDLLTDAQDIRNKYESLYLDKWSIFLRLSNKSNVWIP